MVPKAGKDMECPSDREGPERAEVRHVGPEVQGGGRGFHSESEVEPLEGSEQGYDVVCSLMVFPDCQGRWQGDT